jgi:hypothetical protein
VQVYEVLDNAIDEAQAGFASTVDVILHADGSVSVSDNGRGVSLGSLLMFYDVLLSRKVSFIFKWRLLVLSCGLILSADSYGCSPGNRKICARDCSYGTSFSSGAWLRLLYPWIRLGRLFS